MICGFEPRAEVFRPSVPVDKRRATSSAACLRTDDALLTIHRDSGAILRYYASCEDLVPGLLPVENRHGCEKARELLYRLACQLRFDLIEFRQ